MDVCRESVERYYTAFAFGAHPGFKQFEGCVQAGALSLGAAASTLNA
jgi:hypothetical protein